MASVEVLVLARVPSRGGAPRSFVVPRLTSSTPQIYGSVRLVGLRPDPRWWWIRSLKIKMKTAFCFPATKTAFWRVGSSGPAIGGFPPASELAPIQGVKRSSGSGASPTAPVRRLCRDLEEEGVLCNFFFFLGLFVSLEV